MSLTNEEFAHLDKARIVEMRGPVPKQKTMLRLAFEHITALHTQQASAVGVIEGLIRWRNRTLCWRVPAWIAVKKAQVKMLAGRWLPWLP